MFYLQINNLLGYLVSGGSINVLSTAQENWTPTVDATARPEHELGEFSVLTKGRRDDDSLVLHEPSQADWIRQYMEKEEEVMYFQSFLHTCDYAQGLALRN